MKLRREDVEDGGRMWKRGEEVVEAPYPAPKPYSVLDPTSRQSYSQGLWRVCV
jgi:hypothetical protein